MDSDARGPREYASRPRAALLFVIEPELYRNLASGIIGRQWTECVDPLQSPHGRNIEGRHSARLLDFDMRRMPTAIDIKGQIHAVGALDARINFVFHPVLRHLLVDHTHIPRISRPEVA